MKRYLLVTALLAIAAPAHATTMLFDFGNMSQQTLIPGWNNVTYPDPAPAPPLLSVVDSTDAVVPGVTMVISDQFFINGPPSQLGTESPSGDAAGFPVSATDDYFFGHTGAFAGGPDNQTGGFTLTGLDPNTSYDFTFFSSRTGVNDSRETAYSVMGANSDNGLLEASNNDSNVLLISGIMPDVGGEIVVEVSAGPNNTNGNEFYYINLVQVDFGENNNDPAVPEPATAMLALLSIAGLAMRRRCTA